MNAERSIEILDSTLRDGAQGEGLAFSVEDKLEIVRVLDELGVPLIEGGNPASSPKDADFFKRAASLRLRSARLVAFGSTRRKDCSTAEDEGLRGLLSAGTGTVVVFGKSNAGHVRGVLRVTKRENLEMITDTCAFLRAAGREVIFDAEHFFDGWETDCRYAHEVVAAAVRGGAQTVCLCDTNGGTFPQRIADIVWQMRRAFEDVPLGIHCHNDAGMAVASSVMAVEAGASQVQGTFLGVGERCGNAALTAVIANLQLKARYRCLPDENLSQMTAAAAQIAEISNVPLGNTEPFVGRSAFAHKAGMHVDAVLKDPRFFEHIDPSAVGNVRRTLTSEMSGRSAVFKAIREIAPDIGRNSPELKAILSELKRLEAMGFQYEGASASFEMVVLRQLGRFAPSFDLVSYKVLDELPCAAESSATATLKIRVDGRLNISAAEGEGPVNALDKALRAALENFYPQLQDVRLIDYKVRVLEPRQATAAGVRVLITSADSRRSWTTVGLSTNLIEASWYALVDSIEYALYQASRPPVVHRNNPSSMDAVPL